MRPRLDGRIRKARPSFIHAARASRNSVRRTFPEIVARRRADDLKALRMLEV
jgi:hypothetical protein